MKKPRAQRAAVGRIVHYWTTEDGKLIPNPAITLTVTDAHLWLCVFLASGDGGRAQIWAPSAPFNEDGTQTPREGYWTWPERV